jgi:hypothetical protein
MKQRRSTLLPPPFPGAHSPEPPYASAVPTDGDRESGFRVAGRRRRTAQASGASSPQRDTPPRKRVAPSSAPEFSLREVALLTIVGFGAIALGTWTAAVLEVLSW